jgi:hypothetical protein
MNGARFILLVFLVFLPTSSVISQYSHRPSDPDAKAVCKNCGVIYEIRQLTTERQYTSPLAAPLPQPGAMSEIPISKPGFTISIPLSGNPESTNPSFDAYGSRRMRKQLEEHSYEVVIRYDNGSFTQITVSDVSQLSRGARVRVYQNRIEPYRDP